MIFKDPSVFFVTFHKTASSFFAKNILPNTRNLVFRNYAGQIFRNEKPNIRFQERGYLYGPVRLSVESGPVYENVVKPLLEQGWLEKQPVILFLRDPRDILVSYYYSQAYSHPLSDNQNIADGQLRNRKKVLDMGIDTWVLWYADFLKKYFESVFFIKRNNKNCTILTYEELIFKPEQLWEKLTSILTLDSSLKNKLLAETRPVENKDHNKHRRDGEPGNFSKYLKGETVLILNDKLKPILDHYNILNEIDDSIHQ
jgi:hypothetical protein